MANSAERFNTWKTALIAGIYLLLAGLLMAVLGRGSLMIIIMVSGVMVLVFGVVRLLSGVKADLGFNTLLGIFSIIFGFLMIVMPYVFGDLLMILLATCLIVAGVVVLMGVSSRFAIAKGSIAFNVIVGLLMIFMGVYALLNLEATADLVMTVIGILVAVAGAMEVYKGYQLWKVR